MPARGDAIVIEDDPDARRLIRSYCERLGFRVETAASVRAANALLDARTPDLVCLDLILPEASGLGICERIRATPRLAEVPVLVISARATPFDRALAEEAGASGYIVKPLRWKGFLDAVERLIGVSVLQPS
jgi:two-component system chemotaxis response regulator CheY